jgi:hypothetical protein
MKNINGPLSKAFMERLSTSNDSKRTFEGHYALVAKEVAKANELIGLSAEVSPTVEAMMIAAAEQRAALYDTNTNIEKFAVTETKFAQNMAMLLHAVHAGAKHVLTVDELFDPRDPVLSYPVVSVLEFEKFIQERAVVSGAPYFGEVA